MVIPALENTSPQGELLPALLPPAALISDENQESQPQNWLSEPEISPENQPLLGKQQQQRSPGRILPQKLLLGIWED